MTLFERKVAYVLQTLGCAWIIGITAASLLLSVLFWYVKRMHVFFSFQRSANQ